jgi:hypothetical protein
MTDKIIAFSDEQLQELADDFTHYAATESGFFTDGESYFLTPEQLVEMKRGNDYDFTALLDDFCFHFIYKLMEFNDLHEHKGVTQ